MRCWFIPPLVLLAKGVARLPQSLFLALGRILAWQVLGGLIFLLSALARRPYGAIKSTVGK